LVTKPPLAFQVTAVLEAPVTAAVKSWVAPVLRVAVAGLTLTPTVGVAVVLIWRWTSSTYQAVALAASSLHSKEKRTFWPLRLVMSLL